MFAPAIWALAEVLRSHHGVGLPWLHLSHALVDVPGMAAGVSEVGGPGLTAGIVAVNVALVAGWQGRRLLTAMALIWLVPMTLAGLRAHPGEVEPSPIQGLRIAAAQPDLAPDAATRRAAHQPILDDLVRLSQQAVAERAELIIWPETAYEREVPPEGDAFLGVLSRSLGAPMLIGARRRTRRASRATR